MEKIFRQLLLFASAVVFLALAPLVVFYAMGYRLGINADDDLSVGVLLVETTPRRAHIKINDQDVGTSPRSVPNLPPGDVKVTISKDGYEPWEKRLNIEPTEVTDLRSVRLFPAARSAQVLADTASQFSLAPNRQLIAVISGRMLRVIDKEATIVIPAIELTEAPQQLLWSPDSNSVLLIGERQTFIANSATSPRLQAVPVLRQAVETVWDPRIPGRILATMPNGDLIAYQTATQLATTLATRVHTFATSSRQIFIVKQSQPGIEVLTLQGQLVTTLPVEVNVSRLSVTPSGTIALWDEQGKLSVMVDHVTVKPVADRAIRAGFSPDGQLLYVQTDETSLHVLNISDQRLRHLPLEKLSLAIRLTRPIRDPQWFAGGQHLLFQAEDELIISEIDTRDHPISYTVDSTNLGESTAAVGQDGESLLYLKNTGKNTELTVMPLTLE